MRCGYAARARSGVLMSKRAAANQRLRVLTPEPRRRGRYTGVAPRRLRFSYDRYGKPALNGETCDPLRFNVSHSNDVALYAVARGREVGIDLEFVREDFAGFEIAERFFSPREVSVLRALPPGEHAIAFFDCWARKEAYIKARGEGLSYPLRLFHRVARAR
jgi:4'-phosphopantetheinyl transferase